MVTAEYCQRHCSREHWSTHKGTIRGILSLFGKNLDWCTFMLTLCLFSPLSIICSLSLFLSLSLSLSKHKSNFIAHCIWNACTLRQTNLHRKPQHNYMKIWMNQPGGFMEMQEYFVRECIWTIDGHSFIFFLGSCTTYTFCVTSYCILLTWT